MGCCGGTVADPWSVGEASQRRDAMFNAMLASGQDGAEHMETIRFLAHGLETVVEICRRPTITTLAILAGQPAELYSFGEHPDRHRLAGDVAGLTKLYVRPRPRYIPRCELLLIDSTTIEAWVLMGENHAQVGRSIVGMGPEEKFIECANQIGWRVATSHRHGGGLTILERAQ